MQIVAGAGCWLLLRLDACRAGIGFVHLEELEPVEPDAAAVITLVQHYRRALSAVGLDRPESAVVVGALR